MAGYEGKRKAKILTGILVASADIETDFDVTGWNFYSAAGQCTVEADVLDDTLTLPAGFQNNVTFPYGCEENLPIFTVVVGAGATFYYTVIGKEPIVLSERGLSKEV